MSAACSTVGEYRVEFNLERQYSTFTVTVGQDDRNSTNVKLSYAVYIDNVKRASGALPQGGSVPLKIHLNHALRMRLLINDEAPMMCGGATRTAGVVWGDGQ